jgi:hypothetical protein
MAAEPQTRRQLPSSPTAMWWTPRRKSVWALAVSRKRFIKRSSNFVDRLNLNRLECHQRATSSDRSSGKLFNHSLMSGIVRHDVKEGACGD